MAEHPPVTFGDLKSWADANGVTDEHVLEDEDGYPIVDLDTSETRDGKPSLVVQRTWG